MKTHFRSFLSICEKIGFTEFVPRHKIKVNKASNISDFVIKYSILFLITSSILGSLILGLISKGKEREGIKFMPVLITSSLVIFFIVRFAIRNMLSGLLPVP